MSTNSFSLTDLKFHGSDVAERAAISLMDQFTATALVSREIEQKFVKGVGQTVTAKLPIDLGPAKNKVVGTDTTATNIVEDTRALTITDHVYQRLDITPEQLTFEIDKFTEMVINPAMQSMADKIERICINQLALGISLSRSGGLGNVLGTTGVASTTVDDFTEAKEAIKNARGSWSNRRMWGLFGNGSEKSFQKELKNQSVDFGSERPTGLRDASLGKIYNVQAIATNLFGEGTLFYRDTTVEIDQLQLFSTAAPSAAVMDATPIGKDTVIIDGLPSDGKLLAGMRFTIASESGAPIHVVTEDAIITAGVATVKINDTVGSGVLDNAAITAEEFLSDMIINEGAVAGAIIPPKADGRNSFSSVISGIPGFPSVGIRFIQPGTSIDNLGDDFAFDVFVGFQVFGPQSCALQQKVN